MKTALLLTSLCSLSATSSAWTTPTPPSSTSSASRRNFLDTAAKIVPLVIATDAFAEDEAPAVAETPVVEEAPVVEEEPAAPVITEENELIAQLLKRSEANKDKNAKMSLSRDKLSKRQFSSQYDRPSFVGVHYADSDKVDMILKEDFDKMLASGSVKQTYESKVSKKTGAISDDYSKPIFVFAN
eukprot:CAMPEP_0116139172 /NCGR_PEP_ID=MMETSP0329-20121206/13164_1 /TAXON_ID=697910 /ORGANISM="Pseudo-nitzschia arenysensis, Strain B593" /LENGTH=184 /DNA_ID=CAMNT_0003634185 /DNA_START=31 /DNA_END=585 /DNA_ORIENTATION=-